MSIHNYTLANGDSSATVTEGLNGNFTALSNAEEGTQRRVGVLENTVGGSGYAEFKNFMNYVYPVGCYYWSSNSKNPSELFGGTWQPINDVFVLAAGNNYSAGTTGGSPTVTLMVEQMPSHNHAVSPNQVAKHGTVSQGQFYYNPETTGNGIYTTLISTDAVGGGKAHDNMPPYIVAYCWKRTALYNG